MPFLLVSCFLFCKRADFPLIYVVESFRPAIAGEYKLAQANRACSIEKRMPTPTETTLCVPILILIVYGFLGSRMYLFMLCRCFLQYFHGSDRNTSHTSPIWPTPHWIRSLHVRGDHKWVAVWSAPAYFNPLPLYEGRRCMLTSPHRCIGDFNPLPSYEGRPVARGG